MKRTVPLLITALGGFVLMASYFIPCVGATAAEECTKIPDQSEAWSTRSVWLTADREPDETAVAVSKDVWFSSAEIPADP